MTTIRNNHGIEICKGCFSCAFIDYTRSGINQSRYCSYKGKAVDRISRCEHWEVRHGLLNAGRVRQGAKIKSINTKI